MAAAPYARRGDAVRSKATPVTEHASRSPVAKDRDRIVHSGALRRLQRKSQIVGVQANDFFRTRLTHTLECAQIGRAIAHRSLASDLSGIVEDPAHLADLIEAACLGHDLGHPPFGHNGERALQDCMRAHSTGLFEGNAQSLRIVNLLEPKVYVDQRYGLDLCATTLRAMIKYPVYDDDTSVDRDHPKFCFYETDEDRALVAFLYGDDVPRRTLATEILEASDDIAYAVHDVEDGVWAGMIPLWALVRDEGRFRAGLVETARGLSSHFASDDAVAAALERALTGLQGEEWAGLPFDRTRIARAGLKNYCSSLIGKYIGAVTTDDAFQGIAEETKQEIAVLKAMAWRWMIAAPVQATVQFGQRQLVRDLFEGYWAQPAMLPSREAWHDLSTTSSKAQESPADLTVWAEKARIICDHVAGMTDLYALHVHAEMHQGGGAPNLRLL